MPTPHRPSLAARRALQKLGADIHDARRRRGLPAAILADRAFTSRPTLARVEAGDHSVGIGIYAAVLNALGGALDPADIDDVVADAQDHVVAGVSPTRARCMAERMRLMASGKPIMIASPTRKWPMLSSRIVGIAAIGPTVS